MRPPFVNAGGECRYLSNAYRARGADNKASDAVYAET